MKLYANVIITNITCLKKRSNHESSHIFEIMLTRLESYGLVFRGQLKEIPKEKADIEPCPHQPLINSRDNVSSGHDMTVLSYILVVNAS